MNNAVKGVLIFLGGAGVGAAASALYFKKKYQAEFNEMRDAYNHMQTREKILTEKTDIFEAAKKYNPSGFAAKTYDPPRNLVNEEDEELEEESGDDEAVTVETLSIQDAQYHPYVIEPEDYGDFPSFSRIDLTFYSDGILCEGNEVLTQDDINEKIGFDSLNHFGEYEADSVYVRNEWLQADFCIIRVSEAYESLNHAYPEE